MRNYTTLTSSVTGFRKQEDGRHCEDALKVVRIDGATLMAVADGHGDRRCSYADIGAALAVRAACEVLKQFTKNIRTGDPAVYWSVYRTPIAQAIVQAFYLLVLEDYHIRQAGQTTSEEMAALRELVENVYRRPSGTFTPEQIRERHRRRKVLEERLSQIVYLYGTTLRASVLTSDYIFSLAVGDGDSVVVIGEHVEWLLPAAAAYECETASLCEDINTLPSAFLFSYLEIGDANSGTVADVRQPIRMVSLSTDGLRNSFIGDTLFCEKLLHIADAMCTKNRRNTRRAVETLFQKLTMESVYRDDITAVFAVEG